MDEESAAALAIDIEAGEPSPEVTVNNVEVLHWYRRATRKLCQGIPVIKVIPNGTLVRRILVVGLRPEYLELKSAKLFDACYHLGDLESAVWGCHSAAFVEFRVNNPTKMPRESKCLVIQISGTTLSLIFKSESDRRDAQFLLRCQKRGVRDRWKFLRETYERKQKEAGMSVGAGSK